MSKRNFILLVIVIIIALVAIFGFLYFRQSPATTPTGSSTGTNFFSQFNPFGSGKTNTPPTTTPPVDVSGYVPPVTTPAEQPKFVKVSTMPIAGFAAFSKERLKAVPVVVPDVTTTITTSGGTPPKMVAKTTKVVAPLTEFAPALRYVDKTTGNIFETFADKISEAKFSTTVIPKVYDAYFGNKGQSVVMRYLKGATDTIQTFVGTLPKELFGANPETTYEIKGSFLPDNVESISVLPDTSKLFYLFDSGDNMIGTTLNFADNKKVQVFSSPFTEWTGYWPNSTAVTFTTKPSGSVPGYMYTLNLGNKSFTNTLGNINGLTTLEAPNGKLVLYGDNNLNLSVYHTDTKNSDLLSVRTMPEKCVWGKASDALYCAVPKSINAGLYPDTWYQGEVSFDDQIWKIDIKTGNATMILDPATAVGGTEIDGTKLALDDGENYLFFVNKKDSYLWELNLK
jgi:hypothetical protein